jgi:hypothetical protein
MHSMREVTPEPELAALLANYQANNGVLDYAFLEADIEGSPEQLHPAAALAGMAAIARCQEEWVISHTSKKLPVEMFFRVRWDETKLSGEQVSFSAFWGTDDAELKPAGGHAWTIPKVNGYKSAFFLPPHSLAGSAQEKADLFAGINRYVFGDDPERTEIFAWSTDWSNYFEAGHEWWGAFFWTIRPAGSHRFVVVGASATD